VAKLWFEIEMGTRIWY